MGRQRVVALAVAAALASALAGCGGQDQAPREETSEDVFAVINGKPLTRADIDARLSRLGPEARQEFKSPAMLSSLIDREVNMRVWAEAGRAEGITETEEYKDLMESAATTILADLYAQGVRKKAAGISEKDLREAYERDKDLYSRPGGEPRPYEEVRGLIEKRLKKDRGEAGTTADLQALWERYNVTLNHQAIKRYIGYPVTPEEFIRHIREATSSGDKIRLCDDMIAQFPDNKYAPYALLTMGFVYSEELRNHVDSAKAFRSLIENYPNSNLVDAARWMLENMQSPHPPIRNVEHLIEIAKGAGG